MNRAHVFTLFVNLSSYHFATLRGEEQGLVVGNQALAVDIKQIWFKQQPCFQNMVVEASLGCWLLETKLNVNKTKQKKFNAMQVINGQLCFEVT